MSSIEKKQALFNIPFATVGGMLMGGPAGAIAAGAVAVGAAALQEKKDEELRRREYERKHPDPVKIYEDKQRSLKEAESLFDIKQHIEELMDLDNNEEILAEPLMLDYYTPEYINTVNEYYSLGCPNGMRDKIKEIEKNIALKYKTDCSNYLFKNDYTKKEKQFYYATIEADPYKNNREYFNGNGYCLLRPNRTPYVFITISEAKRGKGYKYTQGNLLYKNKRGKILTTRDFEKALLSDINNPNIRKYRLAGDCYIRDGIGYVYTIDGGENFVLCYMTHDNYNK